MPDLLTVTQAAECLGLSHKQTWHLCQSGQLKAIKPGHDWLIWQDDLEAFQRRPVGRPAGSKDSKPRQRRERED